ncbi:MAG: GMC family oxidoreductase [Armatimonadota bacterium]|nr:GMC family oxidoreductase [Armatimonadota bacterium]
MRRHVEQVDVVVVGCGAGGGVVAKELGEAGLSVLVVEAGRRFDAAADYAGDRVDFETSPGAFESPDPRRDRYTNGGAMGFEYVRVRGVGGSTLAYGAVALRLHESDFATRTRDGVADDWPITYDDLEPYYTAVEYELGVAGPRGAMANPFDPPRSLPYPTPPHEFNEAGRLVKQAARRLGLHMVPVPLAIPTRTWEGRPACTNAGACLIGCKIMAKSSVDVTFVRKAEATGRVEIRPQCQAVQVTVDRMGRARSVVYVDGQGQERQVAGRAIVLAANAVETPRLLLLSRSSRFPQGLANSSGLVGKYFTEHLSVFRWGVIGQRVDAWHGPVINGMMQDFYETDGRNGFARGWTVVLDNNRQWPVAVARSVPGWGAAHKARVQELFGHLIGLATVGEQLPDARNYVALDPTVRDHLGLPVPHIVNEPRENDRAMLAAMSRVLEEILRATGATEIWDAEYTPGGSTHYLGTCRMGVDARTSVVDPWCRTHDVPNLFIADGSVFVTGGGVNPALTIMALAMRTAAGIVEAFRRGEFPC